MNTQKKVILYPLIVMVLGFVVTLLGAEYQLKKVWEKQIDSELQIITTSTLTSIASLNDQLMPEEEITSLDALARSHAIKKNLRLSIVNHDGQLVGDSSLSIDRFTSYDNQLSKQEIDVARIKRIAKVTRIDDVSGQPMVYFAQFDRNTGYTVRAAIPLDAYQAQIFSMRKGFISFAIISIIVVVLFGSFISRLIKQAVEKERSLQEERIAKRTREITLLQTMTTMLSAVKNYQESGQVILNILPQLLPTLSGKLYLLDEDEKLNELVAWGQDKAGNVSVLINSHVSDFQPPQSETQSSSINESAMYQGSSHLICVDLIDEQALFGVIHFLGSKLAVRDKNTRNLVMQLSKQISLGLTNLRVKNQLRNQAIRDPLTNLYNRRFMLEGFDQALNRAERHNSPLAVLMIDLDHFKKFNDTYGHKVGDLVLTEVAKLFNTNLRLEDIACRFGGEEFCIICPDTGLKDAYTLAEKLRTCVSELEITDKDYHLNAVTISVGIAIYPNHAISRQQLLSQADKALYSAKNRGRNTTVVSQHSQYGKSV